MDIYFQVAIIGFLCVHFCLGEMKQNFQRTQIEDEIENPFPRVKYTGKWNRTFMSHQNLMFPSGHVALNRRSPVFVNNEKKYRKSINYDSDYIGPEVVVDYDITDGSSVMGRHHKRNPPEFGFEWERKMELLQIHNLYRRNVTPSASDMKFMEWDEHLSYLAQLWADTCQFMHGFPPNNYPGTIGQNLYMGWDPTGIRALYMWYEEFKFYDFKTRTCLPRKLCGHYTQMVWADSVLLGCAMRRCGPKKFYVVCHYSPGGNVIGFDPFQVGRPCSQCAGGEGGLCANNVCMTRQQCSSNFENCECSLSCQNCGQLDQSRCSCMCAKGWDSLDCSKPCEDTHEFCGKSPGFPSTAACPMNNYEVAQKYCRKMCGTCSSPDGENRLGHECCAGLTCPRGQVIDISRKPCKCQPLCPGPGCYAAGHLTQPSPKVILCSIGVLHFFWLLSVSLQYHSVRNKL